MDKKKWDLALKLSFFNPEEKKEIENKIFSLLDYTSRLKDYELVDHVKESFILKEVNLRKDESGASLSNKDLKTLSKSFIDGYFSVPKVVNSQGKGANGD